MQQSLTYGTSCLTIGINLVMCTLITMTITFEKRPTNNEETDVMYIRILILSYVNIGCLLLLSNMKLYKDDD